jgi:hypothetical protein
MHYVNFKLEKPNGTNFFETTGIDQNNNISFTKWVVGVWVGSSWLR